MRAALLAVAIVLAGCVGPVQTSGGGVSSPWAPGGVTMESYLKLETGMTYEEVVSILGQTGEELSRSEIAGIITVMYQWKGSGSFGANMNAMFQDDKLVSKAQFGLK